MALSGTPIQNRPSDIAPLLCMMKPHVWLFRFAQIALVNAQRRRASQDPLTFRVMMHCMCGRSASVQLPPASCNVPSRLKLMLVRPQPRSILLIYSCTASRDFDCSIKSQQSAMLPAVPWARPSLREDMAEATDNEMVRGFCSCILSSCRSCEERPPAQVVTLSVPQDQPADQRLAVLKLAKATAASTAVFQIANKAVAEAWRQSAYYQGVSTKAITVANNSCVAMASTLEMHHNTEVRARLDAVREGQELKQVV